MAGSSNPVQQTIEALAKERGIDPEVVIAAIEDAVLTASRKVFKGGENLKARFNPETGQVELVAVRTVVETVENAADEISLDEARETYREAVRRGSGQQRRARRRDGVPEADRGVRPHRRADRQAGHLPEGAGSRAREHLRRVQRARSARCVTGMVKRFENGDIIVEIGRIEAVLPRKEQSRAESYAPGDRVRAVIKAVNRSTKGPQIVLSRTDPAAAHQAVRAGSAGNLRRHGA